MSTFIYKNEGIVNTYSATNLDTREIIVPDNEGYITVVANTRIWFMDATHPERKINVSSLLFTTKENGLKVAINGNETWPMFIAANKTIGFDDIRVYELKVLNDTTFFCAGLTVA